MTVTDDMREERGDESTDLRGGTVFVGGCDCSAGDDKIYTTDGSKLVEPPIDAFLGRESLCSFRDPEVRSLLLVEMLVLRNLTAAWW